MKRSEIFDKVESILINLVGNPEGQKITGEMDLVNDLGFDSLDGVEFIMSCEKVFKTLIADSDAEKVNTVGETVDFLEKELK